MMNVAAGQLAVFRGGPSRTGDKAPQSGFIQVDPPAGTLPQLVPFLRVAQPQKTTIYLFHQNEQKD
jgi:hypothetical protein